MCSADHSHNNQRTGTKENQQYMGDRYVEALRVCLCVRACVCACGHVLACLCVCVRLRECAHACMCVHTCVCACVLQVVLLDMGGPLLHFWGSLPEAAAVKCREWGRLGVEECRNGRGHMLQLYAKRITAKTERQAQ